MIKPKKRGDYTSLGASKKTKKTYASGIESRVVPVLHVIIRNKSAGSLF
jgi:hypothetical protein